MLVARNRNIGIYQYMPDFCDAATGKVELVLRGHSSCIHFLAWNPAGTRLASASKDCSVRTWDTTTGKVDLIVVACPTPDGSIFLADGPVFSYYEFKHPMNDRMTDEAWRDMLESDQKPVRPTWYAPLMRP